MEITDNMKTWYAHWFNSPYYDILYKHRDTREAQEFLDNLAGRLKLKKGCRVLDMGCGSGRHSIYLSRKGYEVTGIDLANEKIKKAIESSSLHLPVTRKKSGEPGPSFKVHDMRHFLKKNHFDIILNIFTSFGYFDDEKEDLKVLKAVNSGLKKKGIFVLDFMNVKKTIKQLKKKESKTIDNIKFDISRTTENGFIIKRINLTPVRLAGRPERTHCFEEKVRALCLADFEKYFLKTGFVIRYIFGDYDLSTFDEENSGRLILVAMKK